MEKFDLQSLDLGKKTTYPTAYNRDLLVTIPRQWSREYAGLSQIDIDFQGVDIWNGYELMWVDAGSLRPQFRWLQIKVPAHSPYLIESKALKLYLFSLAYIHATEDEILTLIQRDLQSVLSDTVEVTLLPVNAPLLNEVNQAFPGISLDELFISCTEIARAPQILISNPNIFVKEELTTLRFKSNCLVTGQPDWASVFIRYVGPQIDHVSLLRYLISYRQHLGMHEQCVERIFVDLKQHCQPESLWVQAHFTRRGGLDINPVRMDGQFVDEVDTAIWHRLYRH